MPDDERADYFDQDNTDDQEGTLREAETGPEEKPDYPPAVVPKSVFMGKDIKVDGVYPMRIKAIYEDGVALVCEPDGEKSETTSPEPIEEPVENPSGDFD